MNPHIYFAKYPGASKWAWIKIQAYGQEKADAIATRYGCGPTKTVTEMRAEEPEIIRNMKLTVPLKR